MLLRLWITPFQCELLEQALREKLEMAQVQGHQYESVEVSAMLDKLEAARRASSSLPAAG